MRPFPSPSARRRITGLGDSMLKSKTMRARRAALLCATAMSIAISRQAIGQEQSQTQQPPLPPVTVQPPPHRPTQATRPARTGQRAKPLRAQRAARRPAPANRAAATPAQQAAAAQAASATAYRTREGSEAQGYKPTTVNNLGPFGQVPILDAPYSVNVISSEAWENLNAMTNEDAFDISPVVQVTVPYSRQPSPNFFLRGFQESSESVDGLRQAFTGFASFALEDKERIEILTGLTGFLYGGTDVGGMVNYVYKTPTPIPYLSITGGDFGYTSGYVHLDAGGPIAVKNFDYGTFGYRLNIVGQNGELPDVPQMEKRFLVTGVFDWDMAPGTKAELIASHQDQTTNEGAGWVSFAGVNGASTFNYNIIPNPAKFWSQPWNTVETKNDRIEFKFDSKVNDVFSVRTAYAYEQDNVGPSVAINNYWANNAGEYDQFMIGVTPQRATTHTAYAFVDADFATGPFQNKLTTGAYGNQSTWFQGSNYFDTTTRSTAYNISQGPVYTAPFNPQPTVTNYGQLIPSARELQTNYVVGDAITLGHFKALLGGNYATISEQNFDIYGPPFPLTSQETQSKLTPTYSLLFKAVSWDTTYATYSESLQAGAIVPVGQYTNGGQILPPYLGKEYEFGNKADVGGVLWTAAWFNLNQANQYGQLNPVGLPTYVQDGREVHQGVELTATGNIVPGLRILGGVTLMNATVVQTASITTDNKQPVNVADQMAKTTLEYDLPFLRGLTLTGGVYYVGKAPADAVNATWLAPYVTEDVGLRYRTTLPTGQETIWRLTVKNLTNHAYWISNEFVGAPRTIAFSGTVKF